MGIHTHQCVVLNDTVDTILGGIETINVRTQTEHKADATSGQVYPDHIAITAQKPIADFSSYSVAKCLDAIGIIGVNIGALVTGLDLYAYLHAQGGGRSAGATHRKYSMADGIVVPDKITCDHRGDAIISYKVLPIWDGTNAPVIETDTSAVPTYEADDERFTLGSATIGGVALTGKRNWELDFGINAVTEGADSDIYDKYVSIVDCKPVLTLKGIDVEWLKSTNIPLVGKASTHATTSIYLRKRLQTASGYVADATAEHIKFTMHGLAYLEDLFTSGGKNPLETSLKLPAIFDATNAPVIIDTSCAIT